MKAMALVLSTLSILLGGTRNVEAQASAAKACPGVVEGIYYYRGKTRLWERKLDRVQSKSSYNATKVRSCRYSVWVAHLWQKRAHKTRRDFQLAQRKAQLAVSAEGALTGDWECIHRYEGSWDSNTGNGYYGGLQMDYGFMSTYGSDFMQKWGTANNWPVWAQVTAANRAKNGYRKHKARGYYPWPNTAAACGLI